MHQTIGNLTRNSSRSVLLCLAGTYVLALATTEMKVAAAEQGEARASLPQILTIDWKKGPNLPQGFQDSQGDIIGETLISVAGFCSGEKGVPEKPHAYPRGFLKKVWGLDLRQSSGGWRELPEFPGDARQGMQAIAVNEKLYCWGGFSYSEPYCYRDGYRLAHTARGWNWEKLPDMPWPITAAGICAVGTKIFVTGGADYNLEQFFTAADRNGRIERLGSRLMVLDTANLESGWKELKPCPGTPRWVHATAAVDGHLYVFGGATGSDNAGKATYTVVDNWKYSPATNQWERLADLPIASGNFPSGAIVFENRFILLVGGYQYGQVQSPNGEIGPAYGKPSRHYDNNPMCSDVFVYDVKTQRFGRATSMPLNNNLPMTVLRGNQLHLIGGEIQDAVIDGEHYGHHPDLYLVGTIRKR